MIEKPFLELSTGLGFSLAGLDGIKEYYQSMERILGETARWRLATIDKQVKKLSVDKEKHFREFYHPYRWLLSFPSELRSSVVISGISFLESQLVGLASDGEYYTNKAFEKPKRNILNSCKRHLNKYGDLNITEDVDWRVIKNIYLLRSILVHNGFSLGEDTSEHSCKIESIRKVVPGIRKDEDGFYFIEKELCEKMFSSVENILNTLKVKVSEKWE